MNHLNDNELVLALDGEMDNAELKRAVDHLAECGACRERWEKLQGLSARVAEYSASLYSNSSSEESAPSVASIIMPATKVSSFGLRVPSWSWGLVAAVVLVAASVAFWNASRSTGAHPVAQGQKHGDKDGAQNLAHATGLQSDRDPSREERAQDDKSNLSGVSSATAKASHPSHKERVHKESKDSQQNAANQFTELPFSNSALPLDQDTATVVRVTLPAAALRQAGVPVNEDNANAMLQADVVLGMDGLPRGIRLVNSSSGTMN